MALRSGAPTRLRCEYLENPLGIDEQRPRLSWWLDDERPAELQTAYRILAASAPQLLEEDRGDLWDSGRVESSETCHVPYGGSPLKSRDRVWWKVRTFDSDGEGSMWSRLAFFEVGLLTPDEWQAAWIGAPLMGSKRTPVQVPALRREFQIDQPIVHGRLYISALGLYDVELNGHRAIDVELAPGWTDFRKRVRYQVWDVTRLLARGANAIGVLLADGWYSGRLGLSDRQQYGDAPELIAQLEVVLADRSVQRVVTDAEWRWQRSPILYADLLDGQSVDARQDLGAWTTAGYDAAAWQGVVVSTRTARLEAAMSPLPRVVEELEPVGEPNRRRGNLGNRRFIYDLGQNMVGRVRVKLNAARGTHITVRHAERLDAHGDLYTANLRDARATDSYTCSGVTGEVFEPRFTFHGFQFVEISGELRDHDTEGVTGRVGSS